MNEKHEHNSHTGGCSCGHNHHNEHRDHNNHDGHHSCGGGCGCSCGSHDMLPLTINSEEIYLLQILQQCLYLPVSRFVRSDSKSDVAKVISLAPVYISKKDDDIATVKEIGEVLVSLESKGLVSLDYDIPLDGYTYDEYHDSDLFTYFSDMVQQGKQQHGFSCDTVEQELGSIALTSFGQQVVAQI